jgi:predicted transposase YdaD
MWLGGCGRDERNRKLPERSSVSKPFDSATKALLEKHPREWLEFLLGRKLSKVQIVDADLSTITSEADKVFRVGGRQPWMVHVEFMSGRDPDLALRVQRYNILIRCRHRLPVQSIVVLLRRAADGPRLSGELEDRLPSGALYHHFRYNVVRIWEQPVNEILAGSIATLPLAPIARVSSLELPGVIKRMQERLETEAKPYEIQDLWASAYILMGLIYSASVAKGLLRGVGQMRESATYQAILREGKAEGKAEGKIEEAKRLLLRLGRKKLGPPKAAIKSKIEAIAELARLENLSDRILDVTNWDELVADA